MTIKYYRYPILLATKQKLISFFIRFHEQFHQGIYCYPNKRVNENCLLVLINLQYFSKLLISSLVQTITQGQVRDHA